MRNLIILYWAFIYTINVYSQNVINPYLEYFGDPMPEYNLPSTYFYSTIVQDATNFNGEFQVCFKDLWWFNNYAGTFNGDSYYKDYTWEVVGFPFAPLCAWTAIGCADGSTTTRILELPTLPLISEQWEPNMWRKREHLLIQAVDDMSDEQAGLITNHYNHDTPLPTTGQPYYPHSTLKLSVYFHCGPLDTDPVTDTLIFIYDLTRGRMRDYPFITENSVTAGGSSDWDLNFRPGIVYKNIGTGHFYNQTTNDDLFPNGKTLNYFPYAYGNECENVDETWPFYDPTTELFMYGKTPPYALTTTLIYTQYGGSILAGYLSGPSNTIIERPGIRHKYVIQNNFNLNDINTVEKVIYNPSEVDVSASDLVFPTGYTFKTVRGVYPTEAETALDNISDNGGPYLNPLDIPVKTDLFSENPSDPNNNTLYASRYYLKSGSKLTIQPCVRVFDAVFDSEPGSTLVIDDYQNMIGKEDKSFYEGRYKIREMGGAVLRNRADIQYVRNASITQTNPLHYTALDEIRAGKQVINPDLDQVTDDYILELNSNVTFQAQNIVKLVGGFHAKTGSTFHAFCGEVIAYEQCESENQRISQYSSSDNNKKKKKNIPMLVSPNPSRDYIELRNVDRHIAYLTVIITDVHGKEITSRVPNGNEVTIYTNKLIAGMYSVRILETGQTSKFIKI